VEKDQAECSAEKSGNGNGSEQMFTLRETLLQNILPAISQAEGEECFTTALEAALWSNADLRNLVIAHRTNCLIAKKQILNSLSDKGRETVKRFISELLVSGGCGHC